MFSSLKGKNHKSAKNEKQQDKKDTVQMMKKILIQNKIVNILSHQPRKLMQLAKKSGAVYKNLQQHTLLPKLTLKHLYPQIEEINIKDKQIHFQFESINQQLTCSMVNFQNKFIQNSQQEEGKILELQTKKCFDHIPSEFFQELSQQNVDKLLTKNKREAEEKYFNLMDYNDEIEYNLNQQVGYKMRLFIDFSTFLTSMKDLVEMSCKKIRGSRTKNNILKEIIIQKSININMLRVRQKNYTQSIEILEQIKKVKHMQKALMSLIHAKGKLAMGELYEQYCKQHQKIKQFCCKNRLCNSGDIRYYVERNYYETFNKSLKNYLGQMMKMEKQKLVEILKPKKAHYISTPFDNKSSFEEKNEKFGISLDESIEIDQGFELIIKTNIEKEISHIFQMGLNKCNYSTDDLCIFLKDELQQLELRVYSTILENIQKPKQDLFDNFANFVLNRPTQNSLQLNIDEKILSNVEKFQIINRVSLPKFLQISELMSKKLMDLNIRCFSIANQLMRILKKFRQIEPQKQEIISAYLIQLVVITMGFSNNFIGTFIEFRDIKESEIQIADKLIKICQEWEDFIMEADKKYEFLWRKLMFHLIDGSDRLRNEKMKKQGSFQQLEEFVKLNYSTKQVVQIDESQGENSEDIGSDLIDKKEVKTKILSNILRAKNQRINVNFSTLSKIMSNKEIIRKIENQNWVPISMNLNIQNSVGFLIYGSMYLERQDNLHDRSGFLSKSLLLDKSMVGQKKISQQSIPPAIEQISYQISSTESYLVIKNHKYKLFSITEYILEVLYLFFLYFDKYSFEVDLNNPKELRENMSEKLFNGQKINSSILFNKTLQLMTIFINKLKYYINNLKDLQKKVKSFASFILLTFTQLKFFKNLVIEISNEKKRFNNSWNKTIEKQINFKIKEYNDKLDEVIREIVTKYNSISQQKIKQSINKLEINPKYEVQVPSLTTKQILSHFAKSMKLIQQCLINEQDIKYFLNFPWIKHYLQKVNEQQRILKKYVLKSNGSGGGRTIQQINWESKLQWKQKELDCLLKQVQTFKYTSKLTDLSLIQNQLKLEQQKTNSQ